MPDNCASHIYWSVFLRLLFFSIIFACITFMVYGSKIVSDVFYETCDQKPLITLPPLPSSASSANSFLTCMAKHSYNAYANYCLKTDKSWVLPSQKLLLEFPNFDGYILLQDNLCIIAFRGTFTGSNALTDADASQVPCEFLDNAPVHQGFLKKYLTLRTIIDSTLTELKKDVALDTIYITGHSLGASIATLCAIDLHRTFKVKGAVFALPKVGGKLYSTKASALKQIFTVVRNTCDLVPLVPPGLGDFEWFDIEKVEYIDFRTDTGKLVKNHDMTLYIEYVQALKT